MPKQVEHIKWSANKLWLVTFSKWWWIRKVLVFTCKSVLFVLQIITLSVQAQEDDALLKCLIDMAENTPKYLRTSLNAILELCMKVWGNVTNHSFQYRQPMVLGTTKEGFYSQNQWPCLRYNCKIMIELYWYKYWLRCGQVLAEMWHINI